MSLPKLTDCSQLAWFFDFDGTLVEIAARPEAVRLEVETRDALQRLSALTGGAVAIITGREIAVLDAFMEPLKLPVAGVHGLHRRDANGTLHAHPVDPAFVPLAETLLAPLVARYPELLIERKSGAIAIHYRARASCEAECLEVMEELATRVDGVKLQRGKMVIEARPHGGDKGTAIRDFLREEPFQGRQAVFAGDDVTDEDAFREVNARGGVTIKIGPGATAAKHRARDTAAFLAWLAEMARPAETERQSD